MLEGEFRPGGAAASGAPRRCSPTLRRRSLAALRQAGGAGRARRRSRALLVDWHGVAAPGRRSRPARGGPDALLDVLEQLQGAALPASILERDVLPARLPGYRPEDLDALCAAGEVVWVGLEPLGERDGRVALYLADDLPLLRPARRRAAAAAASTRRSAQHLARTAPASSASCSRRPAAASRPRSSTRCGTWPGRAR